MTPAPIVAFAYRRPKHLKRMLTSLAANPLAKDSRLLIYCDGPKPGAKTGELEDVKLVRRVARSVKGFAQVEVKEAKTNKGLARSVIDGVTHAVNTYGRAIMVEEDARVSPFFLQYMNEALDLYAEVEEVFTVGGGNYYVDSSKVGETFFTRYPDSQAWATWKRSWAHLEQDGAVLLDRLKKQGRLRALDGDGQVRFYSRMLKAQVNGRIDSWAIRWTASCILLGKLHLSPKYSMALNEGFGKGATHETGDVGYFDHLELGDRPIAVERQPVVEDPKALAARMAFTKYYFEGGHDRSLKARVWRLIPLRLRRWYAELKEAQFDSRPE